MGWPGEQLIIKMWDSLVDKGIGGLLKPKQIEREGQAHIELRKKEIIEIAKAEKQAEDIRKGLVQSPELLGSNNSSGNSLVRLADSEPTINFELIDQLSVATQRQEHLRKELNISKAILVAEEELLKSDQDVPEKDVDDDWLYSWRKNASRTSTEELQFLWGRILAGEIASPGTFSIRTLEFIKNLSKREAELITMLGKYVLNGKIIRDGQSYKIQEFKSEKDYIETQGLSLDLLLTLRDLGVLSGVEAFGLTYNWGSASKNDFRRILKHNKYVIGIQHTDCNKVLELPVYNLTSLGLELMKLIEV